MFPLLYGPNSPLSCLTSSCIIDATGLSRTDHDCTFNHRGCSHGLSIPEVNDAPPIISDRHCLIVAVSVSSSSASTARRSVSRFSCEVATSSIGLIDHRKVHPIKRRSPRSVRSSRCVTVGRRIHPSMPSLRPDAHASRLAAPRLLLARITRSSHVGLALSRSLPLHVNSKVGRNILGLCPPIKSNAQVRKHPS